MNRLTRHTPSPAMIVALIALFVALGGAAYAGVTLSNNSVRSSTIVNGQVKTVDLANSAVTNAKLKNNAVNSAKVKDGALEVADLSAGAQATLKGGIGPVGATGPAGATGAAGTPAIKLFATVAANGTLVANRSSGASSVTKDAGLGTYRVFFGTSDISSCIFLATPSDLGQAPETVQVGIQGTPIGTNGVFVQTADNANALVDSGFFLAILC